MFTILKTLSVLLLLLNGIGAFYGSIKFITDPSGASLGMTLSLLEHSPFTSYLIPGIILLIANGIISFVVIAMILFKTRNYPSAIIAEGCILFGWITIQVMMIRSVSVLHIVFWTTAVLLMISGFILHKKLTPRRCEFNPIKQ